VSVVRAVVLKRPGLLELSDVPIPALKNKYDILIRVEACGICGSDLRYSAGENPWALHTLGRHVPNPPNIILGHEYAGVVVEVNSASYEHLLGRRVGAQAFRVCGTCYFCQSGLENLCRNTIHMGHAQGWGQMEYYPGAYAEYCLAWGDLVYSIPESIPLEEAALADVLCVGVHAVGRAADIHGNALCIGGGPIGLGIAQIAKAKGGARVWISDPSPVAQSVLAEYPEMTPIDPERVPLIGSVTAIYNSIGSAETIVESLPLLAEAGTYVNVAVHDTEFGLNAAALGAERSFTSSSNATYSDVAQAYEMICTQKVRMGPMITHRFALENFSEAFRLLQQVPKQAFKVILCPGRPRKPALYSRSGTAVAPAMAE
jgi:threonine dehydrogenase-like Zn-dependent dehydrogenase